MQPHRQLPVRLPHLWDSPGKNTGVGCHVLLQCIKVESEKWKWKVKVKLLSRFRLLVIPWTTAYQAPPSMGFSRQEYWSGRWHISWQVKVYEFESRTHRQNGCAIQGINILGHLCFLQTLEKWGVHFNQKIRTWKWKGFFCCRQFLLQEIQFKHWFFQLTVGKWPWWKEFSLLSHLLGIVTTLHTVLKDLFIYF